MTPQDPIKEAFSKIKQDISGLQEQITALHSNILWLSNQIENVNRTLQNTKSTPNMQNPAETPQNLPKDWKVDDSNRLNPAENPNKQTNRQTNPTSPSFPTDNLPLYGLKEPNTSISTGNEGVPTNSQTVKQTDANQANSIENAQNASKTDRITQIQRVSDMLESLDNIKKEIRSDFKHLTKQEMAVFAAIYSLEEQGFVVDYSLISQKLSLSESSIRDYCQRIIKKGIPLAKSKENNKKVIVGISPELKKIASLQTILSLREL